MRPCRSSVDACLCVCDARARTPSADADAARRASSDAARASAALLRNIVDVIIVIIDHDHNHDHDDHDNDQECQGGDERVVAADAAAHAPDQLGTGASVPPSRRCVAEIAKQDFTSNAAPSDGPGIWDDNETLMLLEAVEHFGDHWPSVARVRIRCSSRAPLTR